MMRVISNVSERGPSAAAWSADAMVLVYAHQGWFDEGPGDGRELARRLATGILAQAAAAELEPGAMAALVRGLLAQPEWAELLLSFCAVERTGNIFRVHHCGGMGLLGLAADQAEAIAPPRTLRRELAAEGGHDVPPQLDAILASAARAAGKDCQASDIVPTFLSTEYEWLLAIDEPLHFDWIARASPAELAHSGPWSEADVRALVQRAIGRLDARPSFIACTGGGGGGGSGSGGRQRI